MDHYQGKDDAWGRKEAEASVARWEGLLKTAREKKGVTLAVAATQLAEAKSGLEAYGAAVDSDAVVALAQEAQSASASSPTQEALVAMVLGRAGRTLARAEQSYAALASGPVFRALGHKYLIAVALGHLPAGSPGRHRSAGLPSHSQVPLPGLRTDLPRRR